MNLFLSAGGGFLIAVLWMDLMFDVMSLRRGARAAGSGTDLEVLAQIAGASRRRPHR